jgi:hypothetical protein
LIGEERLSRIHLNKGKSHQGKSNVVWIQATQKMKHLEEIRTLPGKDLLQKGPCSVRVIHPRPVTGCFELVLRDKIVDDSLVFNFTLMCSHSKNIYFASYLKINKQKLPLRTKCIA